jgi:hypothetical protein
MHKERVGIDHTAIEDILVCGVLMPYWIQVKYCGGGEAGKGSSRDEQLLHQYCNRLPLSMPGKVCCQAFA